MPVPFFIEWSELALASLIMAVGAMLQGCVGFGCALVAGPLLTILGPHWMPGPIILAMLFLTASTWYREWGLVDGPGKRRVYQDLGWALIGRVPGVLMGSAALLWVPVRHMGLLVGIMVLVAVALSLVSRPVQPNRSHLLWAGWASGLMGTTSGVGGPPMALLYQWHSSRLFRVTLAAFFTFGALFSLAGLFLIGRFSWTEIFLGLALVPGTQLGFALSGPLLTHMDKKNIRPFVLIFSTLSALAAMGHDYLP